MIALRPVSVYAVGKTHFWDSALAMFRRRPAPSSESAKHHPNAAVVALRHSSNRRSIDFTCDSP